MSETWYGQENLSKGQRTQLRVILAAIDLFGRDGFQAVTLQQIAKASKTSHPLILGHFGSKENLLLEVRRYVSWHNHTWVDERVDQKEQASAKILSHCHENLAWGFQHPSEAKIILLTYYFSSVENDEGGQKAIALGIARIFSLYQSAENEGLLIPQSLPLRSIAEMTHAFALGLFTQMLIFREADDVRLPAVFKKKLRLFLNQFIKDI